MKSAFRLRLATEADIPQLHQLIEASVRGLQAGDYTAALEVARTLGAGDERLRHPLEVVDFQNEEGGIVGSKAAVGRLDAAELSRVAVSGFSLRDGINRLGGDADRLADCVLAPGSRAARSA